jgi:hypothetical protein
MNEKMVSITSELASSISGEGRHSCKSWSNRLPIVEAWSPSVRRRVDFVPADPRASARLTELAAELTESCFAWTRRTSSSASNFVDIASDPVKGDGRSYRPERARTRDEPCHSRVSVGAQIALRAPQDHPPTTWERAVRLASEKRRAANCIDSINPGESLLGIRSGTITSTPLCANAAAIPRNEPRSASPLPCQSSSAPRTVPGGLTMSATACSRYWIEVITLLVSRSADGQLEELSATARPA